MRTSKKIKHPLVKGIVKEIHPNIFCVLIDDDYDRGLCYFVVIKNFMNLHTNKSEENISHGDNT